MRQIWATLLVCSLLTTVNFTLLKYRTRSLRRAPVKSVRYNDTIHDFIAAQPNREDV
jgi:hypothetical protein